MAYTTTALVKTYLGISTADDDTLIGNLVTQAQAIIDAYCNRTFEGNAANRTFDAVRDVDERDPRVLHLDEDLASITSITNGDGSTVAATKYTTEPRNETPYHAIRLLDSSGLAWEYDSTLGDAEDAITINGVWAYSSSAPDDIVHACNRLAAWMYRQRENTPDLDRALVAGNATVLPAQMPSDIMWLLDPYRKRLTF